MTDTATLSYSYRIYPTKEQEAYFCRCIDGVRWLYNEAIDAYDELDRWRKTVDGREVTGWKRENRNGRTYRKYAPWKAIKIGAELKDLTFGTQHPHTGEWGTFPLSSIPAVAWMHAVGRELQRSTVQFLKGNNGRPRYRSARKTYSFKTQVRFKGHPVVRGEGHHGRLRFTVPKERRFQPSNAWVKINLHRPLPPGALVKQQVIRRSKGKWFATLQLEVATSSLNLTQPNGNSRVGVDRGVKSPIVTSDDEFKPLIMHTVGAGETRRVRTLERRLARQQRLNCTLCQKTPNHKGKCRNWRSRRAQRTIEQLGRAEARRARRRSDWAHKTSHALASSYETIVFEDLKIQNMVKSAAGTVEMPGSNVAQKRGLNRSILGSGWGVLASRTEYKAKLRGGRVVKVDPRNTSRTCAVCGHVSAESRQSQSVFCCVECGHSDNADRNAAINILARGLGVTAEGHSVAGRGGSHPSTQVETELLNRQCSLVSPGVAASKVVLVPTNEISDICHNMVDYSAYVLDSETFDDDLERLRELT